MRKRNWLAGILVLAVAATFSVGQTTDAPGKKGKDDTIEVKLSKMKPDIIKKITEALPAEAPAKPAKARKMLIYCRSVGFVHGSIPYAATALKLMGEKTKAYESVITDDAAMFEADKLKEFDAVFFVSTTGESFDMDNRQKLSSRPPAEQEATKRRRDALMAFIKSGKGFGGLHAASDSNREWPEYQEMIGGLFMHHPFGDINVKVEDAKSPITSMFEGGKTFPFSDEIYVFTTPPYSRDKLKVLLSIDQENPGKADLPKGKRPDKDYALSWIKKHGEGRVFYCALGHYEGTFQKPLIMKHFLAGIQYALGDLQADDTPSGGVSTPANGR